MKSKTQIAIALDSPNNLRGILFVSAIYRNLDQAKDALYAFSFKASLSEFNPIKAFSIVTPKSYIDLGVDPTVKIVQDNGVFFVLEGHSNGICQCGDVINNGNLFKCGVSNTANSHYAHLQNVPYAMNYNWGRLDDFENRIQSGQFLSACDGQIMHARFYNGERPSGTVFRNNATGTLQALFVNQYVDYSALSFTTKLFCGATMPFSAGTPVSSVIVNTFDLVDYYLFANL